MDTALDPNQTSPRHVLLDRADEELAHAYEQLTGAGEEMARAEEQLSKLEQDAAGKAARRKRSSLGGQAVRGFTGLVLAACIFAAAMVSQSSYGDYGQADCRKVGAAARRDCIAAARWLGASRAAEPRIAQANTAQTTPLKQHLWLRAHRKTSRRPPPPPRPS